MKVFTVVGNRPQFIKAAPLSAALAEGGIEEVVLHTGQHWYHVMSQVFFDQLGLVEPRYRLDLHTSDVAAMQPKIASRIAEESPDLVLVFGDTNSTLAGGRAAADASIPLAHVEAGLRSGDLAMPEEHTRMEVDRLAWLLFAPDDRSKQTLQNEGVLGRFNRTLLFCAIRPSPTAPPRSRLRQSPQQAGPASGSAVRSRVPRSRSRTTRARTSS